MENTYMKVIEYFGPAAQKVKAIEEMGELTTELSRDLNGEGDIDAIIGETADVLNMVEQICIIYDIGDLVEKMKVVKMDKVLEEIKPKKTILQDLLEKYPNTGRDQNGTPRFCPSRLGYTDIEGCSEMSYEECVACWNRPLEEQF